MKLRSGMLRWNDMMQMTIEEISSILDIPQKSVRKAIEEIGIEIEDGYLLSEEEIEKLKPVLYRYYQKLGMKSQNNLVDSVQDHNNNRNAAQGLDSEQDTIDEKLLGDQMDHQLEQLVLNHVIMIDTCSLMHEKCEVLFSNLLPVLKKNNKKLIIPYKVLEELKKHLDWKKDPFKASLAEKALKLCDQLRQNNCLIIRGSENDNFADNVFFVHFADYRLRYHMVLITQDRDLSHDILQLNELNTSGGYPIKVYKITSNGLLSEMIV